MSIDDATFNDVIAKSIDGLPETYTANLNNVLITFEDEPSLVQRKKLGLRCNQTLFGLYEGIPLTARGNNYNMVVPDRITLFKKPISNISNNLEELNYHVKRTLWHEIAHYYGLGHDRIHEIESRWE